MATTAGAAPDRQLRPAWKDFFATTVLHRHQGAEPAPGHALHVEHAFGALAQARVGHDGGVDAVAVGLAGVENPGAHPDLVVPRAGRLGELPAVRGHVPRRPHAFAAVGGAWP